MPSQPAVHGRFSQTKKIVGLSRPLYSRGTFALLPGKGLIWRTLEPINAVVVLTPKGVFSLDHQSSHRLASGTEALALMNGLLEGNFKALERSFMVKRESMTDGWSLVLVPQRGALAEVFKSITAQGASFVQKADLTEVSGDETEVRFSAVRPGAGPLAQAEEALLEP
ncbi:MAG: LolA family protein [bacterium]